MKKRIVAMMMALTMAVGLAGCGGSASSSTNAGTGAASAAGENLTVSLSSVIHADEYSIWYSASAVDKDQKPDIYVLYNDGTYIKGGEEYTFKELSEMADEDIVSYVQSSWNAKKNSAAAKADSETAENIVKEKGFPEYLDYYSAHDESTKNNIMNKCVFDNLSYIATAMPEYGYTEYIEGYGDFEGEEDMLIDFELWLGDFWVTIYQSNKDAIWTWFINGESQEDDLFVSVKEQYIAAASAACDSELAAMDTAEVSYDGGTYTIHATTDSTGNNVQSESIGFSEDNGSSKKITGSRQPQAILEAYYGGYTLDGGNVFVIRTTSDVTFSLDTKDTEGIEVD
jgi:hypothetical protein